MLPLKLYYNINIKCYIVLFKVIKNIAVETKINIVKWYKWIQASQHYNVQIEKYIFI